MGPVRRLEAQDFGGCCQDGEGKWELGPEAGSGGGGGLEPSGGEPLFLAFLCAGKPPRPWEDPERGAATGNGLVIRASSCPMHSTHFLVCGSSAYKEGRYSTVGRSTRVHILVLPLTGRVTLGKLLTSLPQFPHQ